MSEDQKRMHMNNSHIVLAGSYSLLVTPAREAPANIASPQSRGMVSRPAAFNPELPRGRHMKAASPSRPRAATSSGVSPAVERRVSSLPVENLPGAVAETPPRRVFSYKQCQYITSSEARAHRFCEAPVAGGAEGKPRQYCAAHYAECYTTPAKNPTNPPPATWLKNRGAMWARG